MRKNFLATSLVACLVVLAGCVQETATTRGGEEVVIGKGVRITNFTTTLSQAEAKDELTFVLTLQNVGNLPAQQVFSEVYAYGDLVNLTPRKQTTTSPNLGVYEEDEIIWDFRVPEDLPAGNTYRPFARVCYVYNSTGYTDAMFVGPKWDQEMPSLASSSSRAPLEVSFDTKKPYRGAKEDQYFEVTFTNVDNGFVANNTNEIGDVAAYTYGEENRITEITLTITGFVEDYLNERGETVERTIINFSGYDKHFNEPGIQQGDFSCEIQSSDDEVLENFERGVIEPNVPVVCSARNVRMMVGVERSLKIFFNTNPATDNTEVSGRVRATADYRYCVQSPSLSITATPG